MSVLTNNSSTRSSHPSGVLSKTSQKPNKDCLFCKLSEIRHEKAQIVSWVLSQDKSPIEKASLAFELTGIEFDCELISCLQDPLVRKFFLGE